MAEITSSANRPQKKAGVARSKKHTTRVDLTPMVDLGFLLITFFIFTTTLSQAKAMRLILPDDNGETIPTKESGALTLLIGSDSNIDYYEGILEQGHGNLHHSNTKDIRNIIIDKKAKTAPRDFVVIIKPSRESNYKELINVLDEMTINEVKKYALVDITKEEDALIIK